MIQCRQLIPHISKIKTKNGKQLAVGNVEAVGSDSGVEYHIEIMEDITHLFTFIYNADGTVVPRIKEQLGDYVSDWDIVDTCEWRRFTAFKDEALKTGARLLLQSGQLITIERIDYPSWANKVVIVPMDRSWSLMAYDDYGKNGSSAQHNIVGYTA